MSDVPESIETLVESIRRQAGGISDYQLDAELAVAVARRDVAVAHGAPTTAAAWQDVALALDDVRRFRTSARREMEELTGPPSPIVRPLTPEELATVHFADEEPPC